VQLHLDQPRKSAIEKGKQISEYIRTPKLAFARNSNDDGRLSGRPPSPS
jgi:hypothetical protein